eukprot:CAMPEP_0184495552 /NCGR_PEP_ID=MMETSP0113_2-20130426/31679_1 /TAXON_ID=91329 /ORGANISM="Norrisiella sphaerica, Strain BC52" /LENGTH=249 /DNA_ID=CAMNT_0026881795 /DNA_START=39 /DNA_END=788 /DNA_ORIENTATION=+
MGLLGLRLLLDRTRLESAFGSRSGSQRSANLRPLNLQQQLLTTTRIPSSSMNMCHRKTQQLSIGADTETVEMHGVPESSLDVPIRTIMTRDPISVKPETGILEAAEIMIERTFAGLPVVDDKGKFVGMVSDIDIMTSQLMPGTKGRIDDFNSIFPSNDVEWSTFRYLKKQLKKISGQTISDLMTPAKDVKSISPDSTVDETANKLLRNSLRRVPVVEGGKLVGIVTRGDILRSGLKRILDASSSESNSK